MKRALAVTTVAVVLCTAAYADDPRCSAPPYGATVQEFQRFVKYIGGGYILDNPTKMLSAICNIKFGGADRTVVYNLGFTDDDIETKSTTALAGDVLLAIKGQMDAHPR